jgi:hypothetical protein
MRDEQVVGLRIRFLLAGLGDDLDLLAFEGTDDLVDRNVVHRPLAVTPSVFACVLKIRRFDGDQCFDLAPFAVGIGDVQVLTCHVPNEWQVGSFDSLNVELFVQTVAMYAQPIDGSIFDGLFSGNRDVDFRG